MLGALHRVLLERLAAAEALDRSRASIDSASIPAKGGRSSPATKIGPNPTDRGRPGMKRHLAACARGTPLGFEPSGANRHDSKMLAAVLDVVPGVRRGRGRPRRRPKKLHADKAYDHRRCRTECRVRSITPRIARRGVERSDRLGRHRWVVERTLARLARFRRLTIRHERRATSTGPSPRWPAPSSASTRSGSFVRRSKRTKPPEALSAREAMTSKAMAERRIT